MGQVLIRNLGDDVIAGYREAAERNGRSLEAELRHLLTTFQPVTAARKALAVERLNALQAGTAGRHHTPSEVLVREIRDA